MFGKKLVMRYLQYYTSLQSISSLGGSTQLSVWYRCARRAEQRSLWTDHYRFFGTLVNWISQQNVVKWTEFWPNLRFLDLNSLLILRHWSLKFPEICDLRVKVGSWELKMLKRGLANSKEGVKRGSSGLHIPIPHFSQSALPRIWSGCWKRICKLVANQVHRKEEELILKGLNSQFLLYQYSKTVPLTEKKKCYI